MIAFMALAALASPPFAGERMRWEVRYAGVVAGHAWAEAEALPDGRVRFSCGARNAPWYDRLYSIDDLVVSTWVPGGGSRRYETRFREGRFHQDQDMDLDPAGYSVWRRQRVSGEWKEWTDTYPSTPGAQDPVSALYAIRQLEGDGPWALSVFTGSEAGIVRVQDHGVEAVDVPGVPRARRLELWTSHRGQLEQRGRFFVWLSDDARRVPVRVVVRTNLGPVTADLVAWQVSDHDN